MTYRPIADVWLLARCKYKGGAKRYGGYPGGFLERARAVLGVCLDDAVLHVCGGMVRQYPYARGFGPNDKTLDLDASLDPDYCQDAHDPYPKGFAAILADPPYTEEDAERYAPGAVRLPHANTILNNALHALEVGRRVGILHYAWPAPQIGMIRTKEVFIAAVGTGRNGRARWFTCWERLA